MATHSRSQPLVLLGAGGHAKVLLSTAQQLGRIVIGVCDPMLAQTQETSWRGVAVLGNDSALDGLNPAEIELINGIGLLVNANHRQLLHHKLKEKGFDFAALVHPSAWVDKTAQLGEGVHVMAGAIVQADSCIGDGSIINTRASVDHDCKLGAHVHIAPGVTLCGSVQVSDEAFIGSGSTIIPGVKIGAQAVVGAGAVVLRDIKAKERYLGLSRVRNNINRAS